MVNVSGIETIMNLVGKPPMEVELNWKTVEKQQALLRDWNSLYIAMLPF